MAIWLIGEFNFWVLENVDFIFWELGSYNYLYTSQSLTMSGNVVLLRNSDFVRVFIKIIIYIHKYQHLFIRYTCTGINFLDRNVKKPQTIWWENERSVVNFPSARIIDPSQHVSSAWHLELAAEESCWPRLFFSTTTHFCTWTKVLALCEEFEYVILELI